MKGAYDTTESTWRENTDPLTLAKRYMTTRLLLPLLAGAAGFFAAAFICPEPWRSLLVNLAAAFVGSVITVFFVDAVLKRQKQAEWEGVRLRTNRRLIKLGQSGIGTVRLALQIQARDVFQQDDSSNLERMHSESIRLAESVLPARLDDLHNLDEQGWKNLAGNLRNLSLLCDQLLSLFGRDLRADVTRLVLDIQTAAEAATTAYITFPDLMGIPDDRLPKRRDGSSTISLRNGWTDLSCKELGRLCRLCAELLRQLPPIDTD